MNNSGCNLLREARTKAQKSYLAGVVYSTSRVDLSRYPGSGRYILDPKGEFYYDGLSNIDNRNKYDNIRVYIIKNEYTYVNIYVCVCIIFLFMSMNILYI